MTDYVRLEWPDSNPYIGVEGCEVSTEGDSVVFVPRRLVKPDLTHCSIMGYEINKISEDHVVVEGVALGSKQILKFVYEAQEWFLWWGDTLMRIGWGDPCPETWEDVQLLLDRKSFNVFVMPSVENKNA